MNSNIDMIKYLYHLNNDDRLIKNLIHKKNNTEVPQVSVMEIPFLVTEQVPVIQEPIPEVTGEQVVQELVTEQVIVPEPSEELVEQVTEQVIVPEPSEELVEQVIEQVIVPEPSEELVEQVIEQVGQENEEINIKDNIFIGKKIKKREFIKSFSCNEIILKSKKKSSNNDS